MLKIENITKYYGKIKILDNISFTVETGEIVGLVGPNGVGKTTLIKSISGLTKLKSGEAYIENKSLLSSPCLGRYMLGCCFQDNIFDRFFNVYDTVFYNAMYHGMGYKIAKKATDDILHRLKLSEKCLSNGNQLSGGMKRRFQLAISLVHKPIVLILDEPTAGLDPKERVRFRDLIAEIGKDSIVLLSTHIVSDVEQIADWILMMKDGQLIFDGARDEIGEGLEEFYLEQFEEVEHHA